MYQKCDARSELLFRLENWLVFGFLDATVIVGGGCENSLIIGVN